MNLATMPPPIRSFFSAWARGDLSAVLTTLAPDAVARGAKGQSRASAWAAERFLAGARAALPIHAFEQDGAVVVTVATPDAVEPAERDWCFRLDGTRISEVALMGPREVSPPGAAGRFVRAVNLSDLEALCACFSTDALVNDQLRDFWGCRAIRDWARIEVIGERLVLYATDVREHHGEVIVTAEVDGDFDRDGLPDPLVLSLHFTLREAWIVRLIILANLAPDAAPVVRRQA